VGEASERTQVAEISECAGKSPLSPALASGVSADS
jgi:hypothetical protein